MDELTEQEGKRCARACGCIPETDAGKDFDWREADNSRIERYQMTDPHFWFGRLAIAGQKLAWDGWGSILRINLGPHCIVTVDGFASADVVKQDIVVENEHPCLALCEAIEKLETP